MSFISKLSDKSVISLLIVNLLPIIGVLFLGWDALSIIYLYFGETFFIGLINILKIIRAEGKITNETQEIDIENNKTAYQIVKLILILFFILHFNLFIGIQVFLIKLVSAGRGFTFDIFTPDFLLSLAFIVASHIYSYSKNYIQKGEYKNATVVSLMYQPYKRVAIQQVVAIIGVTIFLETNAPVFFVLVLIILKTIIDFRSHIKSHKI